MEYTSRSTRQLSTQVAANENTVKTALIAEGGGQRGIFTAGVLDAWLSHQYDPFDILIGTSAGSQNLTSFLSRQKGYAKRLIRGLSRHKRFFNVGRSLLGKHMVDLDWYFDKTKEANRRLDFATAEDNSKQREVLFTATNARNRKAYYFNPLDNANDWVEVIKASSALPYLYKQGVPLVTEASSDTQKPNTDFYLDGGLAAPLPVTEAYKRGARKIVVIRTVDEKFQAQSAWLAKVSALVCMSGRCPKTIDFLLQHEQAYQQELAFLANPPKDVEVIQIFAPEKLQSKLLGSADGDLRFDYNLGVKAGLSYLNRYAKSLPQKRVAAPSDELSTMVNYTAMAITQKQNYRAVAQ